MARAPALSVGTGIWAQRINAAWRSSFDGVIETGRLLLEAKKSAPHGDFKRMTETELDFQARTAQRLMAIARDGRLSNPTHVSHLPRHWGTLYELTKLDDDLFNAAIKDGTINQEMERKDVPKPVKEPRERQAATVTDADYEDITPSPPVVVERGAGDTVPAGEAVLPDPLEDASAPHAVDDTGSGAGVAPVGSPATPVEPAVSEAVERPQSGGITADEREDGDSAVTEQDAPGAFARESAEAMQTGLPCRVPSFASAGSDPGGQVPDVAAAPFRAAGDDPGVAGNVTGQPEQDTASTPDAARPVGQSRGPDGQTSLTGGGASVTQAPAAAISPEAQKVIDGLKEALSIERRRNQRDGYAAIWLRHGDHVSNFWQAVLLALGAERALGAAPEPPPDIEQALQHYDIGRLVEALDQADRYLREKRNGEAA